MTAATWVLVAVTAAYAAATVYYALLTHKLLAEQQLANKKLRQPNVEVALRQSEKVPYVLSIVIRNVSQAPAYNVRVSYGLELETGVTRLAPPLLYNSRFFKVPMPILVGGEMLSSDIINMREAQGIRGITFTAEYHDALDQEYSASFKYDLKQIAEQRRAS